MTGSKRLIISMSFLLAGTAIGAGILGLPIVLGLAGFVPALIGMFGAWIIMAFTGWIFIVKITDSKEPVLDFADLYKREFGHWSILLNSTGYFITFYGIIIAYLSGIATTTIAIFPSIKLIPFASKYLVIFFFILLTLIILFGIRVFRKFNSFFTICLLVIFFVMILMAVSEIDTSELRHIQFMSLPPTLPVLFTTFCFHPVIPLVCHYMKEEKKGRKELGWVLFWGTLIILVLILIWTFLVLTIVPYSSQTGPSIIEANKLNLPATVPLAKTINQPIIFALALLFTFFAILTSYIGAGAGFMNYVKNFTGIYLKNRSKMLNVIIAFGFPLIIALTFPNIFIRMLGIVGGFGVIVIYGFMPAFLAVKRNNSKKMRIAGIIILLVSVYALILEVINLFH